MKWTYNPLLDEWTDPDGVIDDAGPASSHAVSLPKGEFACGAWPVLSDSAGCHPSQIGEYRKHLASHGVDAKYTTDGRVIMESREHRRQILKALQMHDRNSINGW